ncbi:hypothetical protein ACRC7T_09720 [Segnochrobactraceae bacterium EtOH-i3]
MTRLSWPLLTLLAGLSGALVACTPAPQTGARRPTPAAEASPLPVGLIGWSVQAPPRNNPGSCQDPHNVWTGRFASRANSMPGQGGGTGQSLVACFPTAEACSAWLGRAIGASQGIISVQGCTGPGQS